MISLWKFVLGVVVPVKVAVVIAGYGTWAIAAPTGEKRRRHFLENVDHVVQKCIELGDLPQGDARAELLSDIRQIRRSVDTGWHSGEDLAALGRVFKFISVAHTKSTTAAASEMALSCYRRAMNALFGNHDDPAIREGTNGF